MCFDMPTHSERMTSILASGLINVKLCIDMGVNYFEKYFNENATTFDISNANASANGNTICLCEMVIPMQTLIMSILNTHSNIILISCDVLIYVHYKYCQMCCIG